LAVLHNPYAGRPFAEDLSELVDDGAELGTLLGETAAAALGAEVQSYGKAALVGLAGEQEHGVATKIWVRSHYDAFTVVVPDAPLPDEIVVIVAVASRGRLHERVGGVTRGEALRR
jgi:hypothetical protein